jgi:hypothetical protein
VLTIPDRAGPHHPTTGTPARRPGSCRRTSSIDSSRPDGLHADVRIDGRARDLVTNESGAVASASEVHLSAVIDPSRALVSATSDPPVAGFEALVGVSVASGWRARAVEALGISGQHHSLLNLLVDDLPGASLVSGVALQAAHALPVASPGMRQYVLAAADICAGWVSDGSMLQAFRAHDQMPAPVGPPAPILEPNDDDLAWHQMEPLSPHATRRRRRLDLWVEPHDTATHAFEAHFRDSHVAGDGHEQVVHEYLVTGCVDAHTRTFIAVEAQARVLPWVECPNALASAGRLVGTPIGDVRARVRSEFVGVSTCTHLNDTLRSLADIEPWLDLMTAPSP